MGGRVGDKLANPRRGSAGTARETSAPGLREAQPRRAAREGGVRVPARRARRAGGSAGFRGTAARGGGAGACGAGLRRRPLPAEPAGAGRRARVPTPAAWGRAAWPTRSFPELACSSPSACSPPACESAAGPDWGRTRKSGKERVGRDVAIAGAASGTRGQCGIRLRGPGCKGEAVRKPEGGAACGPWGGS